MTTTTKTTTGPAAEASRDAGAEARGLAKLRELKIAFDEGSFCSVLTNGKAEAVRAFLDAGMSANRPFADDSRSPLMALFFGYPYRADQPSAEAAREIAKDLLAHGADVNYSTEYGYTALMFAANNCDRPTVRLLLNAGAKLAPRDKSGSSALQHALPLNTQAAEELIAAGARLDAQTVKEYLEAYKDNPKALALVKKAAR